MPVGRIEHSGNTDYLKDNLGRTVLTKEHGISSDTVYDRLHQPVVRIEHGVNADQMKDDLGRTVLTKEHGISSDTLYDELHRPVGRIEHGISTANVPAGGSTT
jgi:lambda repressor-like predicted transcriptional regulator